MQRGCGRQAYAGVYWPHDLSERRRGTIAGCNSERRKVPEGLKPSPSGGPNGSTTSHGTRTAYRFRYSLA
jgi:hypothetical protein